MEIDTSTLTTMSITPTVGPGFVGWVVRVVRTLVAGWKYDVIDDPELHILPPRRLFTGTTKIKRRRKINYNRDKAVTIHEFCADMRSRHNFDRGEV